MVRWRDRGEGEEGELAMAPKKRMNAWRNEITHVLYGIHRETFKVQSASLTRAGVLSMGSVDARVANHFVAHGRDPRLEALSVFHLFEVAMLPVELCGWESASVIELEKKAEEMRLAAN